LRASTARKFSSAVQIVAITEGPPLTPIHIPVSPGEIGLDKGLQVVGVGFESVLVAREYPQVSGVFNSASGLTSGHRHAVMVYPDILDKMGTMRRRPIADTLATVDQGDAISIVGDDIVRNLN
jgi:hypothetical protein